MKGACEYYDFCKTGQYGKLFIQIGQHARGKTLQIWVLPSSDPVQNPRGGVQVYGIISGQPGWTETYGWLHEGPWQEDFYKLIEERQKEIEDVKAKSLLEVAIKESEVKQKESSILESY